MGRAELRIAVPAYFKCPISLDIMKSPVSLSTGVTYDRSSIEKWLADGHNTCPATMQALQTRELVPNHTLGRLIQAWFSSTQFSDKGLSPRRDPEQVKLLLHDIAQDITDGHLQQEALRKLSKLASDNEEHRICLVKAGAIPVLASILSSKGSDISNARRDVIEICEEAIRLLFLLSLNDNTSRIVAGPKQLITIAWLLNNGVADARIYAAVLLQKNASTNDVKQVIGKTATLMEGLLSMLKEVNPIVVNASLKCLLNLCSLRRNQLRAVERGAVELLLKLLQLGDKDTTERVFGLLNLLCGCAEGRAAAMDYYPMSVTIITKTLLKFSNLATQQAIAILWAICYSSADSGVPEAMVECNGLTKILLLLQSNCNSITKQKAGDLLRLCREICVTEDHSSSSFASSASAASLQDSQHSNIKPF